MEVMANNDTDHMIPDTVDLSEVLQNRFHCSVNSRINHSSQPPLKLAKNRILVDAFRVLLSSCT